MVRCKVCGNEVGELMLLMTEGVPLCSRKCKSKHYARFYTISSIVINSIIVIVGIITLIYAIFDENSDSSQYIFLVPMFLGFFILANLPNTIKGIKGYKLRREDAKLAQKDNVSG
jgi:hypothetical protein